MGRGNARRVAKAYGADVEKEEPIAPVECNRWTLETSRDEDRCLWCGQVLMPAAIAKVRKDEREIRRAVLKLVRDDPEVIDQLERSERLMDVLASRPELEEEIVAMAEELGG